MKVIFTDHALGRMVKRQLERSWVENVINTPLRIKADKNDQTWSIGLVSCLNLLTARCAG